VREVRVARKRELGMAAEFSNMSGRYHHCIARSCGVDSREMVIDSLAKYTE